MEEIEVPIEKIQEDLHEHAEHSKDAWVGRVALSSAILACVTAVAALLAGHHSNEAMISQIQSSDQWGFYQAKGIKSSILSTRIDLLTALGKPVPEADREKFAEYKKEQEEISHLAKEKEAESREHLLRHQNLARSVTFFQVAITIGAISVLMRRRSYWYLSLVFGAVGLASFLWHFLH